jgi:ferredoxin
VVYYNVLIEETGESFRCSPQETLLAGMERLGRKGIPVGCRGGGCGVCKIEITAGTYLKRVMSREYVSLEDEAAGRVLACRVRPTSDIRLRVLGKMSKNLCRPQQRGLVPSVLAG